MCPTELRCSKQSSSLRQQLGKTCIPYSNVVHNGAACYTVDDVSMRRLVPRSLDFGVPVLLRVLAAAAKDMSNNKMAASSWLSFMGLESCLMNTCGSDYVKVVEVHCMRPKRMWVVLKPAN